MVTTAMEGTARSRGVSQDAMLGQAEFAELYVRYRDPVFRYLRRQVQTEDEAADLTAQAFERALTKLDTFRGEGAGFAPWLFRIARNLVRDARRRRRSWIPLQALSQSLHPTDSQDPDANLLRMEAASEISRHLEELTALQQECLALRYGAGLTAGQIGLVIGKSEEATQKLLTRALTKLKENYRG